MSNNYIPIPPFYPFKNWVCNNFPFIEETFDGITNYQLMSKIVGYLNLIKGKTNELGEQVDTLQDWFDNLDVQDEVDNKLDEMAKSGELEEMITAYLQINGVLAFNTLSDLVSATNIIDGSICRTLGKITYNDGYGSFYKIRTITSGDTVDGENIVALNISNTLIAEKILDANIIELDEKINRIFDKKILFIGDSYGTLQNNWIQKTASILGLTLNSTYFVEAEASCGFLGDPNVEGDKTFLKLLNNSVSDITEPNEITDVIVGGGVNDKTYTTLQLQTAIQTFVTRAKTLYPNAKVSIGMISWSTNNEYLDELTKVCNAYAGSINFGGAYINNSEYALRFTGFLIDAVHPNEAGQQLIASTIANYVINGTGKESFGQTYTGSVTGANSFTASSTEMKTTLKNSNVDLYFKGLFQHSSSVEITYNGTWYKIGTFADSWLAGGSNCIIPAKAYIINANNERHTRDVLLKFAGKEIFFAGYEKTGTSTTDLVEYMKLIQIPPVYATISSLGN